MKEFEKIYKEHYPMVYRIGIKMLGEYDSVADIVQEVFVLLYEKLLNDDQVTYLKSWLYRVTYNKSIDFLKKQKTYCSINRTSEYDEEQENNSNKEQKELLVRKALLRLPERDRFIVAMYSEGFSYKEIAQSACLNPNSIGKILSRALKKLEKELKTEYYELLQ